MFYLQLALLHEDYASGRIDYSSYFDSIVLLAEDHARIKLSLRGSTKAA